MKQKDVEIFCEENGFNHRKDQYKIMEQYFGIGAGTIKDMMSFHRYLRDILPVDEVGIAKEKEWHKPAYMQNAFQTWEQVMKNQNPLA